MKVFLKKHLFALLVVLTVMAAFAIGASAAGENRINFPTNASNVTIYSGNARVLEDALYDLTDYQVPICASGRTDKGVHAICQCAHFEIDREYK